MSSASVSPPARFGTILGVGPGGVPAYSSDYPSANKAEYPDRTAFRSFVDGHFMGYKWQCVEYARRWLYLTQGWVFDDVPMAYDIFQLRWVRSVRDGVLHPLRAFRNGAKRWPEPGALLIWNEGGEFVDTGHVAVVTEVFADRVRIAEQNVGDHPWPDGQTHARELVASVAEDGAYWIECTFGDATILGWIIQTDDATHAENVTDADPSLFVMKPCVAMLAAEKAGQPCLDPRQEADAVYMAANGGCHIAERPENRDRYFQIGGTAARELRRATNELHAMFMHATAQVLRDDALLRHFCLPEVLWPRLRQSWNRRQTRMITGRFDFSMSERGLKIYEYNADSASCHMECGRVQGAWARYRGCDDGQDAGAELFDNLVHAWRVSGVDSVLHIMRDQVAEETYHARYMQAAAEKAGLRCKVITGLDGLHWNAKGQVVDADGEVIAWVWKTWAWETVIDQIRDACAEDDEDLRLQRGRPATRPLRLADVMLHPDVMVFEPLWTLIPSNKAILPILWQMYPDHPYLLDTRFTLDDDLIEQGYVAKPIVGRCGANISIFDADAGLIGETCGQFANRETVYQALFPLPKFHDQSTQIGAFSVAGRYAGAIVRVDPSPIITTNSDLLPLRVVSDDLLKA